MNDNKENKAALIVADRHGVQLQSLDDMHKFAHYAVEGGFAPKGMNKIQAMVAMQYGLEIGMTPLQALSGIAVINGRPSLWGDAMTGVVRGSGLMEYYRDEEIGKPDTDSYGYRAITKRKGEPTEIYRDFTVADAKKARLWGKAGPWTDYPKRMLMNRARSWVLRDVYPDALKGIIAAEEALDVKQEQPRTPEYTVEEAMAQAEVELGIEQTVTEKIDALKARAKSLTWDDGTLFEFIKTAAENPSLKSWDEIAEVDANRALEAIGNPVEIERITGEPLTQGTLF